MSDKRKEPSPPADSSTATGNRRKLLAAMLTGGAVAGSGALPKKWTSPVVDSILMPAHAQTSPAGGGGGSSDLNDPCMLDLNVMPGSVPNGVIANVNGVVTGSGVTEDIVMNIQVQLLMNNNPIETMNTTATTQDDTGVYSASVTFSDICSPEANSVRATVTSNHPALAGQQAVCERDLSKMCEA